MGMMTMSKKCPLCDYEISNGGNLCPRCCNNISGLSYSLLDEQYVPSTDNSLSAVRDLGLFYRDFFVTQNVNISMVLPTTLPTGFDNILSPALEWITRLQRYKIIFKGECYARSAENIGDDVLQEITKLLLNEKVAGSQLNSIQIDKLRELFEDQLAINSIRADSVYEGCIPHKESDSALGLPLRSVVKTIEKHMQLTRSLDVFIAAPSHYPRKNKGQDSVEILVARELKRQFDLKGLDAFWWEDFNRKSDSESVHDRDKGYILQGAKIAYGLAMSPIMLAFAFSVEKQFTNNNDDCYEPYMVYEINTFKKCEDKTQLERFIIPSGRQSEYNGVFNNLKTKAPAVRRMKLFSNNAIAACKVISNLKGDNEVLTVSDIPQICDGRIEKSVIEPFIRKVVENALKEYFDIINNGEFDSIIKKIKAMCPQDEDLESWFVRYVGEERGLDFFHSDYATPYDWEFDFAIFDENGDDVAYRRSFSKTGTKEDMVGKFEFFIERENADGDYSINCVVRDWNKSFTAKFDGANGAEDENSPFYDETTYDANTPISQYEPLNTEDENAQKLYIEEELIKYTRVCLKLENSPPIVYNYDTYSANDGKIKIFTGNRCHISGQLIFSSPRGNGEDSLCEEADIAPEKTTYYFFVHLRHIKQRAFVSVKSYKNADKPVLHRKVRCLYCANILNFNKFSKKRGKFCSGETAKSIGRTTSLNLGKKIACRYNCLLNDDVFKGDKFNGVKYSNSHLVNDDQFDLIPERPVFLPDEYYKENSGIVSLIGVQGSGKSVFISNSFGLYFGKKFQGIMPESDINWHENIDSFFGKTRISFYRPYTWDDNDKEQGITWKKALYKAYPKNSETDNIVSYVDYAAMLYSRIALRTPNHSNKYILDHMPFIMSLESTANNVRNYISYFDCPGEYLNPEDDTVESIIEDESVKMLPVTNSDGYIFFVSPRLQGESVFNLGTMLSDAKKMLDKLVKRVEQFHGKGATKNKVIAIVFSQFDKYTNELLNWFKNTDASGGVFPDCYYDIFKAAPVSRRKNSNEIVNYLTSPTAQYIDNCSEAIHFYLKNNEGGEFIDTITTNFDHYKFFAVSALARDSSLLKSSVEDKEPYLLYRAKTHSNVDLVSLWLAYMLGMVK